MTVLKGEVICPGKFIILVTGDTAAVTEAVQIAISEAGAALYDSFVLPRAHMELIEALRGQFSQSLGLAVGVVETLTAASGLVAADQALKTANVKLRDLRFGFSLGGRCFFILEGKMGELTEALKAAESSAAASGNLGGWEILGRPSGEMRKKL